MVLESSDGGASDQLDKLGSASGPTPMGDGDDSVLYESCYVLLAMFM